MRLVKNQPVLVKTNTNEFYFPSRLIYRIKSKNLVLNRVKTLSCIYKDPVQQRWIIECSNEALRFKNWNKFYVEALKKQDPIVIAFIKFPSKDEMHVYLCSFERVIPVLKLLDKYLPRDIAMGTHHDISFKLVTAKNQHECPSPEVIFADESKIVYSEHMREIDRLEEKARLTGQNYDKKINAIFKKAFLESHVQTEFLPDLQRTRLESFYVDGAETYEQAMNVQSTMALAKHSSGGRLNPLKFFEKVIKNDGKKIDKLEDFLS
ncbi:MAG: hypothetical protein AB2669_08290 [Candidatus Thiodiazotropha endolucinida]